MSDTNTAQDVAKPVDYSKDYAGKRMYLTGKNAVCAVAGLHFSLIPDAKGQTKESVKTIPDGLSPLAYGEVHKLVSLGILALAENLSDKEIEEQTGMSSKGENEPSTVEDLSLYDQLLNLEIRSLEKELSAQQKEHKKPKEWFQGLLEEENYSQRRESYIELITKFI